MLYVGDIPSYLTADQLYEYFSEFQDPSRDEDPIIDTQVLPGLCSGFVTFATFEDALDVLKFVEQQPLALEDRELRISWATEQDIEQLQAHFGAHDEGGDGAGSYLEGVPVDVDPHGVHPKAMDARAMAAKVAEQRVQHDLGAAPLDAPAAAGRDVVSYDDL